MNKPIKNVAASARQRLLNLARESSRPFDELLQYFAMERFLYRLSRSKYKDKVVLKGALMFVVWKAPRSRATRDIDLLGRTNNTVENLVTMVKEVCAIEVEADGMSFLEGSVKGKRIKEDADYEGVRVTFTGKLGQAKAAMQIDFGFGDTVSPKPREIDYPTFLDMPAPKLRGYPRETVIAEKFEAMTQLGLLNSRMKDFYDIWLLSEQFNFDGKILGEAIKKTFANRKTKLEAHPVALTDEFTSDAGKIVQWRAFIRRTKIDTAPKELKEVVGALRRFLPPIATAVLKGKVDGMKWNAPGPWA
ncbi:MAG: nucleotidyl transferase AbiEii/AbiGii toxin family protein [Elusimicrobiota bacterium]